MISISSFRMANQRGYSLVELMVAMVIALIIMAGVVNSFLASKDSFNYNQEMAFIQENARYAANRLSTEIRAAGDFGCRDDALATNTSYVPNNLVSVLGASGAMAVPDLYVTNTITGGIQGYNPTTGYPSAAIQAAVTAANSSDAVIVRHADVDNQMTLVNPPAPATTFTLSAANSVYQAGTIMVYADAQCRYQGVFQARGPAPSATTTTIDFSTGGASASLPGNAQLMNPALKFSAGAAFPPDSKIAPLSSSVYYIAQSNADTTMKSLWVTYLDKGGLLASQELIVGVDDMRIYYGVDTDAKPDGFANEYVTADQISANQNASGGNTLAWNRVASVRVQLLLRSRNKVSTSLTQTLQWDAGATFTKGGGYVWQIASVTVRLRNAFRG